MLTIAWHLLSDPDATYTDLDADYYETRMPARRQARNDVKSLERSGYRVIIQAINADTGQLPATAG
jgi:transposase